ncbi:uncharacterized protein [Nicotiana tomentosiformis]|uniref:uncharacterized protein n=1 Tax=Nicotiana tomentosiformis TaxID=4098 RepID=UPI00388C8BB0
MDNTYIQCKPTAMVVGSMVMPKYADYKTIYTPKDIQTDMLSDHGVNLTYMQAWRVKEKALEFLRGHPADSYSRLPSYLYILEKTYPGSVVKLQKSEDDCFLYVFVALSTSIKGWEHCRPVVVVDGTFLKSAYMGIMLTASTMDATGIILPLAYAVVDSENDASWRHDTLCLHVAYLDKCKVKVLEGSSKVKRIIEEIDTRVKAYLYDISYQIWSRVHATVNRTWTMTSNIAESLNAVTKDARELPVVKLLEYMRTLREHWTNEKLLNAKGMFTYLGKKYNKEFEDNRTLSQKMRVRALTYYIHTVIDGVKRFILDELPCAHALVALRHRIEPYEIYYSPYYTSERHMQTYEIPVDPLPDESKWNVPQHIAEEVVKPPTGKRQPGRPQKQRYKPYDEVNAKKYKASCGNCGVEEHNKRSCMNAPKRK